MLRIVFHNHSEGYYSLFLVFMYAPLFSRTSHVTTEPLPAERCRGVSPLQTRSKSNGPPQYINPYFIIIPRGITICSWRSRLRRSSAEPCISRGRLHAVSCKDARWVDHEMIGHEREVAVFSSVNNVGLVCDAGGGSSLHQRER
jgi:hypothetical protein